MSTQAVQITLPIGLHFYTPVNHALAQYAKSAQLTTQQVLVGGETDPCQINFRAEKGDTQVTINGERIVPEETATTRQWRAWQRGI